MQGRNIEIKARVPDRDRTLKRALTLSDTKPVTLHQTDTFFNCPNGRLKLREFENGTAELIFYNREDSSQPKMSEYYRYETVNASLLSQILDKGFHIKGIVRKQRVLLHHGQTRIHLDQVEGLGDFLELEVVLTPDQSEEEGGAIAQNLMQKLGISTEDLIEQAYIDLLASPGHE